VHGAEHQAGRGEVPVWVRSIAVVVNAGGMTNCNPTPKPPGEKNMIARSRDWEAAEERGQALERGDFFGAAGMTENNWGQEQKEVPLVVLPEPKCCRRHRRQSRLFGGGIRER